MRKTFTAATRFMRLDYFKEDVPDAATLPHFRHLLEEHGLQKELFRTLNGILEKKGKSCTEVRLRTRL